MSMCMLSSEGQKAVPGRLSSFKRFPQVLTKTGYASTRLLYECNLRCLEISGVRNPHDSGLQKPMRGRNLYFLRLAEFRRFQRNFKILQLPLSTQTTENELDFFSFGSKTVGCTATKWESITCSGERRVGGEWEASGRATTNTASFDLLARISHSSEFQKFARNRPRPSRQHQVLQDRSNSFDTISTESQRWHQQRRLRRPKTESTRAWRL